jgi:hypothetical protein
MFARARPLCFGLAALLAGAVAARADSPRPEPLPPPDREEVSMQRWGAANRTCAEWTNACEICQRGANGRPQCSTPGIACLPKTIQCVKRAAP